MAADDYDHGTWWRLSLPRVVPAVTIACDCGAEVRLVWPINKCGSCGATWNMWGKRVRDSSPPEPPNP